MRARAREASLRSCPVALCSAPMRRVLRSIAVAAGLFFALSSRRADAAPPIGNFDSAACDLLAGWSQDPDEPDKVIQVHLYFGGPAGSGAMGIATLAGVHRDDLCTAIGSCAHGFSVISPLSLHDGQPHEIHAYGIDSQGGTNPEIGAKTASCAAEAPTGVRRKIDGSAVVDAWHFSTFWDLLPLSADAADALPEGPTFKAAPLLVKSDDGSATLWLVDGGLRRLVPPEVVAAWKFDLATVETRPAAKLSALVEGTALRSRPVLFLRGGLYLVDDPQPSVPTPTTASSGAGAGGSGGSDSASSVGGGAGEGSSGSCGVAAASGASSATPLLWMAGGALMLLRARRLNRWQRALRSRPPRDRRSHR